MHSKYGLFIVGLHIKPDCAAVSLLFQLIRHRNYPGPTNLDLLWSMMKTCRWRTLQRFPGGLQTVPWHRTRRVQLRRLQWCWWEMKNWKKNSIYKNPRTKIWHNEPLLISSAWLEGYNKSASSGKTAMMGKFWNSFPVAGFCQISKQKTFFSEKKMQVFTHWATSAQKATHGSLEVRRRRHMNTERMQ